MRSLILNRIKTVCKNIYSQEYFRWITHRQNQRVNTSKAKYLMIVVHPDDEMIFFNRFLTEYGPDTLVLCLTNGGDQIRRTEFAQSMEYYQASGKIYNYLDSPTAKWDEEAVCNKVKRFVNQGNFKTIITHNSEGEYGHQQHIYLHHLVMKALRELSLQQEITVQTSLANEKLFTAENQLNQKQVEKKIKAFSEIYQSQAYFILDQEDMFYRYMLCEGLNVHYRRDR